MARPVLSRRNVASVVVLIITSFAGACGHRYRLADFPDRLAGRKVTVRTVNGRVLVARPVPTHIGIAWTAQDGTAIHPGEIAEVIVEKPDALAAGMLAGALAAGAAGVAIGYAAGDDEPCVPEQMFDCMFSVTVSAEAKAVIGGAVGAVMGGALGWAIMKVTSSDRYVERDIGLEVAPTDSGGVMRVRWSF
jgi:hypothetical protein